MTPSHALTAKTAEISYRIGRWIRWIAVVSVFCCFWTFPAADLAASREATST